MAYGVGTTHHVKIGDYFYLLRPGSYRKQPAPLFGSRFTSGDPNYNTLNQWQYWAQTCWVGGSGAEEWSDDAMYDEAVGVDTTKHEVMLLSRDLTLSTALGGRDHTRTFIVFNKTLYMLEFGGKNEENNNLDPSRMYRWSPTLLTWTWFKTFAYQVRSLEVFRGKLFVGDGENTMTYMNNDETFTNFAKPAGVGTEPMFVMKSFRERLYVAFADKIWRLKPDLTWDGSTVFYDADERIETMEIHLGFLYMGTTGGKIYRCDGNNTHEMWSFESGMLLRDMRSFDGRLFLMIGEKMLATPAYQSVLYQFSGAAVTELQRWGYDNKEVLSGKMRVYGGRLWFGASYMLGMGVPPKGFGIAVYDPREDAYHIWATNKDYVTYPDNSAVGSDWRVDDVFYYNGYMFASVRGAGIFFTKYSVKDATRLLATYDTTPVGLPSSSGNGGWYTSSDFDGGTPGLLKMFHAIKVHVDLPSAATSIVIERSMDGGLTWSAVGTKVGDGIIKRYATEFVLASAAGVELKGTRLKYRIQLKTSDTTKSPQLRGVIVRYQPIPEPNWMWDMTLVLSDKQELLDGTIAVPGVANVHTTEPTINTKLASLREDFRVQDLIQFTEPGGVVYASNGAGVRVHNMEEFIPHIGPVSAGSLEYEIRLTLMETIDAYEA